MSDYNSNTTTTTRTPGYTDPAVQPLAGATHTTHVRETQTSTNWFAWLLGGAVVAVGIAAFVFTGNDATPTNTTPAATGNNVTIESPATATEAPAATPVAPVAPEAPVATQPDATAPAVGTDAPAAAEPVAPAPEAVAPAPSGN